VLHCGCRKRWIHCKRLKASLRASLIGQIEKLLGHVGLRARVGLREECG
jgi:hypothetical protein